MKKIIAASFLSMLLCAPMAFAGDNSEGPWKDGPGGGERMENRINKMFETLNLSDEQKKLVEANRAHQKDAKRALMENMKNNMKAMGEELKKTDLDMAKLNALHEQQKQLMNQMSDQRFQSILEVRKILTKEQFTKFTEMMEKRGGPHGFGRGNWHKKNGNDKEDKEK